MNDKMFYSVKTGKAYSTEAEYEKAVAAYDAKVKAEEDAKKAKENAKAKRAKEVEDAIAEATKAVEAAQKAVEKRDALLQEFAEDYGYFHMSIKNPRDIFAVLSDFLKF